MYTKLKRNKKITALFFLWGHVTPGAIHASVTVPMCTYWALKSKNLDVFIGVIVVNAESPPLLKSVRQSNQNKRNLSNFILIRASPTALVIIVG